VDEVQGGLADVRLRQSSAFRPPWDPSTPTTIFTV
jgi:hypothetical protein